MLDTRFGALVETCLQIRLTIMEYEYETKQISQVVRVVQRLQAQLGAGVQATAVGLSVHDEHEGADHQRNPWRKSLTHFHSK